MIKTLLNFLKMLIGEEALRIFILKIADLMYIEFKKELEAFASKMYKQMEEQYELLCRNFRDQQPIKQSPRLRIVSYRD